MEVVVTTQEIYQEIVELDEKGRLHELLEAMEVHWPVLERSRDGYAGEACRFAGLAARKLKRFGAFHLWKARALTAYAVADNKRGIAMLVLSEAFAAMVSDGTATGAAHALHALDGMRLLIEADQADENVVPTASICERVYWEKRGFFNFNLGRFGEATAAYREALKHTRSDLRGATKVQGGLILSIFLAAPDAISRDAAVAGTEGVVEEARRRGWEDLAVAADENCDLLRAWRAGDDAPRFTAYEVL